MKAQISIRAGCEPERKRVKKKKTQRPAQKRTDSGMLWVTSPDSFNCLVSGGGYTVLKNCPEIQTAANRIADLISVMTIHLMTNTKSGDQRIKNELSRKIDINPNKYTTRKNWMYSTVRNILLDGDGNSIQIPHFLNGYLDDIEPMDMGQASIIDEPYGYHVYYRGQIFQSDEILHFTDNIDPQKPWKGCGYKVMLKDLSQTLAQARATSKSLMESPVPSLIVKIDGMVEELQSEEGRKKLTDQYIGSSKSGKPWMIPADAMEVVTVKPLTISDLAISDSINLDKRTAAAIIGVPPFLVGVGTFDRDEFNNFISTRVLPIARGIEQELTRKLLLSPDWFFRFNPRSLFSYSLTEISEVACNYVDRAIIDRNEAREWSGWNSREGLDELAILENYIPYSKIGNQKKLKGGNDSGQDSKTSPKSGD